VMRCPVFDSCNSLLSSVHTLLVSIMRCVCLYIKKILLWSCSVKIGDRDLEAKVDERLLLRFYGCGCSDENQNEDNLDDKNIGSIQETEVGAT